MIYNHTGPQTRTPPSPDICAAQGVGLTQKSAVISHEHWSHEGSQQASGLLQKAQGTHAGQEVSPSQETHTHNHYIGCIYVCYHIASRGQRKNKQQDLKTLLKD